MDISHINKAKGERSDKKQSTENVMPSQGLIEFFLDHEYKRDDMRYCYSEVKCLDETDGKFKHFNDLSSTRVKSPIEGDYKNYCDKCDKQFNSLLAAKNHYIFNHPCQSMLTKMVPGVHNSAHKKRNYNWLEEPIQWKSVPKNKEESPHIIIIKDKEEYLKKLNRTQKLVHVTEEVRNPTTGFTLENIKAHPQEGIKVVKKSDIKFEQLRIQAEQKILFSKRPEPQIGEAPSKKLHEPERQLIKIDINEALKGKPKSDPVLLTEELLALLRKSETQGVKYLCRRCNLEMFDPYVFDSHMRQHINATFTCPFCTKTFCTKIGIANHTETCKEDSPNTIVKIVRLPKKKKL